MPFSLCRFSTFRFQNLPSNGLIPKQSTDYYVIMCAFQSLPILSFPFPKFILERFDSETVNILLCHDLCLLVFADSQLSQNFLERFDSETVNILLCHDMCSNEWFDSETVFSLCRFSTFRFQNLSSNGLPPKQSTDYYVMIFALRSVLLFCLYVLC